MKKRAEVDEPDKEEGATPPHSVPRGTGKALKDVLRTHHPDPDFVDEMRELREFIGPAQSRWRD